MDGYGYKEVLKHFEGTKVKCYLTGKEIDITKDSYQLDHITPVSKGGTGEINNMGICIPEANQSKSDMLIEEYLDLCKSVLENFGYKVEKIE